MNVKILFKNDKNLPKIKYVFDFIFSLPICKERIKLEYLSINNYQANNNDDIIINYGKKNIDNAFNCKSLHWFIDNAKIIHTNQLKSISYTYNNKLLYGIGLEETTTPFYTDKTFNLDIVQTFFFHLSRMEEYYAKKKQLDYHDRMISNEQFLVKNNIYKTPVIDEIAFAFLKTIGLEKEIDTIKIMSHDIDVIQKFPNFYKFIRGVSRILFKNKKHKGSLVTYIKWYFKVKLGKKDPYNTFSWLFSHKNMHQKFVYFMSGGLTNYDNLYAIDNPKLKKYIQIAKDNNYIIGLHPSYLAYTNVAQFNTEKLKLETIANCKIKNSRQHILHYDLKKTTNLLENNGILTDSTYGFQDKIGFRCGTGFTYYLWDFNKNNQRKIKERPLIIMDGCLLIEADYNVDKAKEIYNDFYTKNKQNTQITFNFHNSIFDPVLLDNIKLKKLFLEL